MEFKDWAIIFATLVGPVLAVQAQKWVERIREKRNNKRWVFNTLMATRAARLSLEHVQALNMIELAFYGSHTFGFRHQTKAEGLVIDAWHKYLDDLSLDVSDVNFGVRGELFTTLLMAIAKDVGYKFDRLQIQRSVYSPMAHSNIEHEQSQIRKGVLEVLSGKPLKLDVVGFPADQALMEASANLQKKMSAAFDDGSLSIEIKQTGA